MSIYEKELANLVDRAKMIEEEKRFLLDAKDILDKYNFLYDYYKSVSTNISCDGSISLHCNGAKAKIEYLIKEEFPSIEPDFDSCDYGRSIGFYLTIHDGDMTLFLNIHEGDRDWFAENYNWEGQCFSKPKSFAGLLCKDEAREAFVEGSL